MKVLCVFPPLPVTSLPKVERAKLAKAAVAGLLLHTATSVLELYIHPFCEQLVITGHSVCALGNSQIKLTDW